MAAPNIVNVSTITGITTAFALTTTSNTLVASNAASSNQVLKINTLMASNITANAANITVKVFPASSSGLGVSYSLANTISVPAGSSLAVIGKDTTIYLEENRSIGATAGTANAIDIIVSYEVIS